MEWRRKNGGKGRNKITVFHRATWGRLRGRKSVVVGTVKRFVKLRVCEVVILL